MIILKLLTIMATGVLCMECFRIVVIGWVPRSFFKKIYLPVKPKINPPIRTTKKPTIMPTIQPTIMPTIQPTIMPTIQPTTHPIQENDCDSKASHISPRDCGIRRGVNEELARERCQQNQTNRFERSIRYNYWAEDSLAVGDGLENASRGTSEELTLNDTRTSPPDTILTPPGARIVGGEACGDIWPWMVLIFYQEQYQCGGSVIDHRHVLLAAHCFDKRFLDPVHWKIYVGEFKREDSNVAYDVEDIHIHEKYKPEPHLDNDIAVMRLKEDLPRFVVPICLPAAESLKVGDETTVIGWGKLSEDGDFADRLQELHGLKVLDNNDCNTRLKTTDKNFKGVQEYQMCVGGEEQGGKDACQGDSGGPLMHKHEDDRWFEEGIVSFGYGCARPGLPGLYTKVSHYIDWLEEYIKTNNGNNP